MIASKLGWLWFSTMVFAPPILMLLWYATKRALKAVLRALKLPSKYKQGFKGKVR